MIALLPSLAAAASRKRIPLWIVTTGAQQAAPSDFADGGTPMPIGVVGAAVWGFARVLINETPLLSLRLIDFPPTADGPSAGERSPGSWRRRRRKPKSSGPGRAGMCRGCAAGCRRAGRPRVRCWRSMPDRRAASTRLHWRPAAPPTAGTGRGFDRGAGRRAQFPRSDVGNGAAARGGADRGLRRPDLRARMRRDRPRGRTPGSRIWRSATGWPASRPPRSRPA